VPGTSRCLHGAARKDINTSCQEQRRILKELQIEEKAKVEDLLGRQGLYIPSALGQSLLQIRTPKMFFARAIISALETLRCATRVGSDYPQYSKAGWARS
jgi:hypothetical protein